MSDMDQKTATVHRFVQEVERAMWTRDVDAFLALFRPDAVWTNPFGRRLTGMGEIAPFTAQGVASTPADIFVTYQIEHIQFLGDSVAVVNVRTRSVTADRTPIPGEADGAKLYVLVLEEDAWKFAAAHNILVNQAAIEAQRKALAGHTDG